MIQHYVAILQQGQSFLSSLSDEQYNYNSVQQPSSIGKHIRHILDHFMAVEHGLEAGVINYEHRHRGGEIESSKQLAISVFEHLTSWFESLPNDIMTHPVEVIADIGVGAIHEQHIPSTVGRELMFACSHATHHYALLKLFVDINTDNIAGFGVAPSTMNNDESFQNPAS